MSEPWEPGDEPPAEQDDDPQPHDERRSDDRSDADAGDRPWHVAPSEPDRLTSRDPDAEGDVEETDRPRGQHDDERSSDAGPPEAVDGPPETPDDRQVAEPPDPDGSRGRERRLDELVDAARSLDPGADALPDEIDPLAGAGPGTSPAARGPAGGPAPGAPEGREPWSPEQRPSVPAYGEQRTSEPVRADRSDREQGTYRPGGGPSVRRPARVIALANQKGGVGKTTSVINLGAALAELGNRVLLVDMDPQGSLGVGIGAEPHTLGKSVYNLLLQDGTSPDEVILQTAFEDLHVMPSNIDLAAAEIMLVQEVAREQSLRRVLDRLRYRYDFILVDCPPSLGLLTINGLTAADGVVIPLECEYFALRGMTLLMNTIRKVQERLNPDLEIEGILATMVDTRTIHAREVLERVHEAFGNLVFKSTINKTIRFAEAPVAGEPILTYAAENRGAEAYRELAREVLSR